MKNTINLLLIITSILLFSQCKPNKPAPMTNTEYSFYPLEYDKVTDVKDIVDSIKVISLGAKDSIFFGTITKVLINKDSSFIIKTNTGILQFTSNGNFVKEYGCKGRGAGEYISAIDICINTNADELLILDAANTVLIYSLTNGDYIKSINVKWSNGILSCDAIAPSDNGGFFILSANPSSKDDAHYCLNEFDSEGVQISEYIPNKDYVITQSLITQSYDNRYLVRVLEGDNICHEIYGDNVKGLYSIDFGNNSIPKGYIYDEDGMLNISRYVFSDYYKFHCYAQDTHDYIVFSACGPGAKENTFIYSKLSKKGIRYENNGMDTDIPPLVFRCSDGEFIYGVLSTYSDKEIEKTDPLQRLIIEKYGVIETGGNLKLVGVRFKF